MNGLYDFYSADLRPVLLEQERKRKRVFSSIKFNLIMILGGSALLTPLVWGWLSSDGLGFIEAIVPVSILSLIYMIAVYRTIVKNHRVEAKQHIISRVLKFIDPELRYRAESRVSGGELEASGFFERGSTVHMTGEDFIVGRIYDLGFKCSEIHLPRVSSEFTDGELTRFTFRPQGFKGLFAVIELPERLDSVIYIFPNNFSGKMNRQFATVARLERIKLEDPTFERYFNAYATDQLQSRMVLTTKLIDDISTLRQRLKSDIMLSIKGNRLYIAVASSKDLFEPNIFMSYLNPEQVRDYLKELNIVMQLVEDIQQVFKRDI